MVQFFARSIPRISFHSHDLPSPPHPSPFPFLLMAFPPLLTPLLSLRFLGLSITLIFPFLLFPYSSLPFFPPKSSCPSSLPSPPVSLLTFHFFPSLPVPSLSASLIYFPPFLPQLLLLAPSPSSPWPSPPQDSCISQAMSKRALRASEISSALRSGRTFFSLLSS